MCEVMPYDEMRPDGILTISSEPVHVPVQMSLARPLDGVHPGIILECRHGSRRRWRRVRWPEDGEALRVEPDTWLRIMATSREAAAEFDARNAREAIPETVLA
jgi:hypothetical protein